MPSYPDQGHEEPGKSPRQHWAETRVTPWTGCQAITCTHTRSNATGNFETAIRLPACLWTENGESKQMMYAEKS